MTLFWVLLGLAYFAGTVGAFAYIASEAKRLRFENERLREELNRIQ